MENTLNEILASILMVNANPRYFLKFTDRLRTFLQSNCKGLANLGGYETYHSIQLNPDFASALMRCTNNMMSYIGCLLSLITQCKNPTDKILLEFFNYLIETQGEHSPRAVPNPHDDEVIFGEPRSFTL